ncbi:MAG: VWA domain-containing protein [Pyrinomonadaceae bacterium]
MKQSILSSGLICTLLTVTAGQQSTTPTQPTPQKPTSDTAEVVRITTNLVQIDAVVTDRRGQHIGDLGVEEFEVFEDGRPQKISNFSYVSVQPESNARSAESAKSDNKTPQPPRPPEQLRPEQVRRSIALIVDDLGLSFESTHFVRNALRKFVDEQMQSGDMVAIIRTGAGVGALQQFTTDKRLLHVAIDRLKWNAFGRRGIAAFGNIGDDAYYTEPRDPKRGTFSSTGSDEPTKVDDFKDEIFTVGTLGALNYVVRGLRELPGRKSAVLLTDALDLFSSTGNQNYRVLDSLRRLIDLANRSSVVFYTIDARGLMSGHDSAANALVGKTGGDGGGELASTGLSGHRIMSDLRSRSLEILEAQNGMSFLARQTGGLLVTNNNDIAGGIRRVLDQKGYYLIGYRPQESTFDASGRENFHRLEVRVKRSGLSVRTRSGFYGVNTEAAQPVNRTTQHQLLAALTSPFATGALDLRLTSVFLNDASNGSFVRSLIHVGGSSLTFTEEPDGTHKASVDVAAVTFSDEGMAVDQRFRTETVNVRGDQYRAVQRDGITFGINLPVKKPGAFQLRIAVRDVPTGRVGSANQFIEVPNLKKNRIALSGLYVAGNTNQPLGPASVRSVAQDGTASRTGEATPGRLAEQGAQAGPAVRRFRPGMVIDYGYEAYNIQLDRTTGRAQLQTQLRLFHENQQVYTTQMRNLAGQPGAKRLTARGSLQLGQNLKPGDYILQVIVTDVATKDKRRIATQWIPFEVE